MVNKLVLWGAPEKLMGVERGLYCGAAATRGNKGCPAILKDCGRTGKGGAYPSSWILDTILHR